MSIILVEAAALRPGAATDIMTPEQFGELYEAITDASAHLLVETAIKTGLRWGELTELRVGPIGSTNWILAAARLS